MAGARDPDPLPPLNRPRAGFLFRPRGCHDGRANTAEDFDETIILAASALVGDPLLHVIAREHPGSAPSWISHREKAPSEDGAQPHWQSLKP